MAKKARAKSQKRPNRTPKKATASKGTKPKAKKPAVRETKAPGGQTVSQLSALQVARNSVADWARRRLKRGPLTPQELRDGIAIGYALMFVLFFGGLMQNVQIQLARPAQPPETILHDNKTYKDYQALAQRVADINQTQSRYSVQVVDGSSLEQELATIGVDVQLGRRKQARSAIAAMNQRLDKIQEQLTREVVSRSANATETKNLSAQVPILLYHYTPADFARQMDIIAERGYTTIDLADLVGALTAHTSLPAKPIIITFDDGFSNQMQAADVMAARNLKATFYIINGGEASHYCIGANRRQGAPCGDSYLNWNEIRRIDQSPLFTIGAHTVDHLDLGRASVETQRFEIEAGKREIERELGHTITDFCYPYGSFTHDTIVLLRQAGFTNATSTLPGVNQTTDTLFSLKRIRDVYELP